MHRIWKYNCFKLLAKNDFYSGNSFFFFFLGGGGWVEVGKFYSDLVFHRTVPYSSFSTYTVLCPRFFLNAYCFRTPAFELSLPSPT